MNQSSELSQLLRLREAGRPDMAYVVRSWMKTYASSPMARALGKAYYPSWRRQVDREMAGASCKLACLIEDTTTIVGFVVYRAPCWVHYACVRAEWRHKGVASMIVESLGLDDAVHYTHTANRDVRVPLAWVYDPMPALKEAA